MAERPRSGRGQGVRLDRWVKTDEINSNTDLLLVFAINNSLFLAVLHLGRNLTTIFLSTAVFFAERCSQFKGADLLLVFPLVDQDFLVQFACFRLLLNLWLYANLRCRTHQCWLITILSTWFAESSPLFWSPFLLFWFQVKLYSFPKKESDSKDHARLYKWS